MARKGETWNESETYRDAITLREVRRVTTQGMYNQTPTYHTNIGFTADGEFLIFGSARGGMSAIFRCHVSSGEITQLIDPVPGLGSYGALHKGAGSRLGNGQGVTGQMCIAPKSRWAVFTVGRAVRAVQIETLEEQVLIPDIGEGWVSGRESIDWNEETVVIPLMKAHPEVAAGQRPTKSYMAHFAEGGMALRLLRVPLAGGEVEVMYEEQGCSSAHCPHCPTDPDLLLIDRDFPPRFWGGSDGKTNRIWTLRLSTGELTELLPRDRARFQVHSAWTWDGEHVVYHGHSADAGYYIGVTDPHGQTMREYLFRDASHYGHVSAMAGRPAIILDGNLTKDMLLWLYYDQERPRIEVIARHSTDWGAMSGQFPHPHPLSDPTGNWISYNAAHGGRSDVYVVKV